MISLRVDEISDPVIRENFNRLVDFFNTFALLKGDWRFVSITFTGAVTNFKYPHGLNFIPKDVISLSTTGAGSATFNISRFDKTNLDITTTGACVVRAFVGSYRSDV